MDPSALEIVAAFDSPLTGLALYKSVRAAGVRTLPEVGVVAADAEGGMAAGPVRDWWTCKMEEALGESAPLPAPLRYNRAECLYNEVVRRRYIEADAVLMARSIASAMLVDEADIHKNTAAKEKKGEEREAETKRRAEAEARRVEAARQTEAEVHAARERKAARQAEAERKAAEEAEAARQRKAETKRKADEEAAAARAQKAAKKAEAVKRAQEKEEAAKKAKAARQAEAAAVAAAAKAAKAEREAEKQKTAARQAAAARAARAEREAKERTQAEREEEVARGDVTDAEEEWRRKIVREARAAVSMREQAETRRRETAAHKEWAKSSRTIYNGMALRTMTGKGDRWGEESEAGDESAAGVGALEPGVPKTDALRLRGEWRRAALAAEEVGKDVQAGEEDGVWLADDGDEAVEEQVEGKAFIGAAAWSDASSSTSVGEKAAEDESSAPSTPPLEDSSTGPWGQELCESTAPPPSPPLRGDGGGMGGSLCAATAHPAPAAPEGTAAAPPPRANDHSAAQPATDGWQQPPSPSRAQVAPEPPTRDEWGTIPTRPSVPSALHPSPEGTHLWATPVRPASMPSATSPKKGWSPERIPRRVLENRSLPFGKVAVWLGGYSEVLQMPKETALAQEWWDSAVKTFITHNGQWTGHDPNHLTVPLPLWRVLAEIDGDECEVGGFVAPFCDVCRWRGRGGEYAVCDDCSQGASHSTSLQLRPSTTRHC